jgi:hypothetical protein
MVRLKRTKHGDQHFYVMAGISSGTQQIGKEGIAWLEKRSYHLPAPGGWVTLDLGDYQYLKKYLSTKGVIYTRRSDQPLRLLSSNEAETEKYGPPLLLRMASDNSRSWTLLLKLDKWEEDARNTLLDNKAAAVGCWTPSETNGELLFSSLRLIMALDPTCWPKVAPQTGPYTLYWQDSQSNYFLLQEATPSKGLKEGWQGNVFCKFEKNQLPDTWERCLPGGSITLTRCQELYWLAQSDYKPEWPEKEQRIRETKLGWQLWRLQTNAEKTSWEAIFQWLSYRQLRLTYPSWRIHVLNPLSVLTDLWSIHMPDQPLLVRCDPPTENRQTHASLSLIPYLDSPESNLPFSLEQSHALSENQVNYLCFPSPTPGYKYRIQVTGEASGQPILAQIVPPPTGQPSWLRGLRCTLTTSGKQHVLEAFAAESHSESQGYQFQVPDDFSLKEMAELNWSWQPSEIPCTLHWEFRSSQGALCSDKSMPSTVSEMNNLWKMKVWSTIEESQWATFMLDAASFGSIRLKLLLKPESIVHKAWWTDTRYVADFFWLSRVADQETIEARRVISPALQQTLRYLCQPAMPPALQRALMRLSSHRNMPTWAYLRLQALLADLCPNHGIKPNNQKIAD